MAIERHEVVQGHGDEGDEHRMLHHQNGEADVVLEIPSLSVAEIGLEVDKLRARISVEARLADLLHLHVGASADVDRVALDIKGVEAEAHLRVRLENVVAIVDSALATIDKHPEILIELARGIRGAAEAVGLGVGQVGTAVGEIGHAVGDIGEAAASGLLSRHDGSLAEPHVEHPSIGPSESADGAHTFDSAPRPPAPSRRRRDRPPRESSGIAARTREWRARREATDRP